MFISLPATQTVFTAFVVPSDGTETRHPIQNTTTSDGLPAMRLTDRDRRILEAIHAHDGLLSVGQIQRLFFTGRSQTLLRLRLLHLHRYLARPDRRQRAGLTEPVYWLAERGAAYVAGLSGTPIADFHYRREPRWMQVAHDVAVSEVQIALEQACNTLPGVTLDHWVPQSEFWSHHDRVEYADLAGRRQRRYLRPDGYAVVRRGNYICRLLLELDRATEDNPRFAAEKVLPGVAYVRSEVYRRRFGHNSGKWLIVTTGERRLVNMLRMAERAAGRDAGLFYFTTLAHVTPETILTEKIWRRGGADSRCALL